MPKEDARNIQGYKAYSLSDEFRLITMLNTLKVKDQYYRSEDKIMKELRDFLAMHHITNVASDSYTLDWDQKTITITAYAETKAESRLINQFIADSPMKYKRVIQKA